MPQGAVVKSIVSASGSSGMDESEAVNGRVVCLCLPLGVFLFLLLLRLRRAGRGASP